MRSCPTSLGFALLILLAATAATPLPRREDRSVYDGAGIVDAQDEQALERLHRELYKKTGVAIVVITVRRLEDEGIADFAVRVGQSWGVGQEGADRGLVVALSLEDRRIFVATGYGTESYLPDGRVGRLIDQYALPDLKTAHFSTAIRKLCGALASTSAAEFGTELSGAPPNAPPGAPEGLSRRQLILGGLFLVFLLYMGIKHPRLMWFVATMLLLRGGRRGGRGFGGSGGFGGFGGGGFGGGGAGRSF
jgi:uncharacterized protein